jgi:hypothetical protein
MMLPCLPCMIVGAFLMGLLNLPFKREISHGNPCKPDYNTLCACLLFSLDNSFHVGFSVP